LVEPVVAAAAHRRPSRHRRRGIGGARPSSPPPPPPRAMSAQSASVIRKLAKHGAAALKPQRVGGPGANPWRRPLLSRRQAADARKQALASGTFGTFDASRGGWLEAWDDVAAPRVLAAPKLHKRERTRADRFASVEANLADMPKKIAAYRAAVDARKPPPGVESLMKRLTRRRK